MLGPIYSAFNFVLWSLSTLLWLIWWLFIIVAIITFIGFINVKFFTKNNVEFNEILKAEEKFYSLSFLKRASSISSTLSPSPSDNEHDDKESVAHADTTHNNSNGRSGRMKKTRKLEQRIDPIMEPTWTMSKRFKRYHNERQESPASQSSHSDSISIVSASVSQCKSSKPMSEDDHQQHLLSPDNHNGRNDTRFSFKLTPRMRKKRKQKYQTPSDSEPSREIKSEEDVISSEQEKIDLQIEGIPSHAPINTDNKVVVEFNADKMQSFDDIYNYMVNNVKIEDCVKAEVKQCIENGHMKLKSFERALLMQKLSQLEIL